ncbi:MAG: LysM peptidoglycan-binding domain-containing protein [Bacilli bacterium]|nr:LysM peptidoglycan-binding domain-containing protein [Bacilli bacterium]
MAKKIVIDPGHGGNDPGTINNGIVEKDYTLKISQYIKRRLDELGIENAITREGDETLDATNRPKRVQSFFGDNNDVIVVSNHINAGGGDGAEVIYALRNTSALSSKIAKELENAGQNVRKYYQRRLPSNPAKDYYYILRDTPNNETIIVEYGFADSTGDDVAQLKNNWERYAEAVVKALADYIGVAYIPEANTDYYVVAKGDTLWNIARKFGITVNEIKSANNLNSNALAIGQTLFIPGQTIENIPISGFTYTVKSGDTLYSIAQKYNTSVSKIKELNNLTANILSIGQTLKISDDNSNVPEVESGEVVYTVKSGDNLYAIARKYNVTVDAIKKANNLSSNLLSVGQNLIIPVTTTESSYNTYIVKYGDNLYSIAKKYNVSVDNLKSTNNLTNNILSVGQMLIIPSTTSYITYIVKPGDSLYSIARTFGTTVSEIESLNNLSTSILSVGQQLLLPNK